MIMVEHAFVPCVGCGNQLIIYKEGNPLGVFEVTISWDKYEDPIAGLTLAAHQGKFRVCCTCLGQLKLMSVRMDQPIEWLPPETHEKA